MRDRLQAIGYTNKINLPPRVELTAAEKYLGNSLDRVTQQLNDIWHQSVLPNCQTIIDRNIESLSAGRQERINIDKNDLLEPHD